MWHSGGPRQIVWWRVLAITCPKCNSTIHAARYNQPAGKCSGCGSEVQTAAFASLISGPSLAGSGQRLTDSDQAGCYYHPHKTASVPCDNCGRFLCSLCDVDFGGKSLCPVCIDNDSGKNTPGALDTDRFLYDKLAIYLAIIPLLVTQIAALFLAIKYIASPISIPPRGRLKVRWILAIVISLGQLWWLGMWIYEMLR